MKLLHLAWRNVLRNVRRSLITVSAIAVGLASLIFIWGFIDGINEQMIENSTRYLSGHLKIHKSGFHEEGALYLTLKDDETVPSLLARTPGVEAFAPRIEGKAMLSGTEKSRGVRVVGIDPELEPGVTTLSRAMAAGRYLRSDDGDAILLGDKTAQVLHVTVGDEVVLITQAMDGSIGAGRYQVVGIFDSGINILDGAYVFLPLAAARDLYSLWGQVTAWVLRLDERQAAPLLAQVLRSGLGEKFEVLDWKQLLPAMVQMVEFHEVVTYVVLLVVFIVVAVGIANTILMAVMERVREFGVMMALGATRMQIIVVVITESVLLGLLGLIIGNALGLSITGYFAQTGLNLGQYTQAMESMPGLSGMVYPLIRSDRVLLVSAIVFLLSIVPALYPAWRVARLEPVQAIHGIEPMVRVPHWLRYRYRAGRGGAVFWKIAGRGILRNPRRSALTAGATAFGLAAFLFLYAFADGFFEQMIDNSTGYVTGHLQVEQRGFREEFSAHKVIDEPDTLLKTIRNHPAVIAATPRVQAQAMISSPTRTEPLVLFGVEPTAEQQVTLMKQAVIAGRYLRGDDLRGILLGRKLVEKLGVRLGEKVVVTLQLADGSLGSAAYRLGGVFSTDNDLFDDTLGFINLRAAQNLLDMAGQISTVAVALRDRKEAAAVVQALRMELSDTTYDVLSWEELLPVVVQMIELTQIDFLVVLIVVFIIVAMGVMNTLLMSVLERTREFGVMMALGTRPGQIIRVVVYESIILGAAGILIGSIIGTLLVRYFGERGMDLSGFSRVSETIPGITATIHPVLIFDNVWLPTLILFVTGVVASVYPASRAARLEPVQAIRYG